MKNAQVCDATADEEGYQSWLHNNYLTNTNDCMKPKTGRRSFLRNIGAGSVSAALIPTEILAGQKEQDDDTGTAAADAAGHVYNGIYKGANLNRIAFPLGGMGAGMFCLEGTGVISHMSIRNKPEVFMYQKCLLRFLSKAQRTAQNCWKALCLTGKNLVSVMRAMVQPALQQDYRISGTQSSKQNFRLHILNLPIVMFQ
jgi:hypothetical protein